MITGMHSNVAGPAPWPSQFAVFLFGRGGVCKPSESCDFGYCSQLGEKAQSVFRGMSSGTSRDRLR
jgi:hypothetical protein